MITEDKKYYVYILFKTYNIGNFIYDDLKFDMEPFYVGKGTLRRMDTSKKEVNSSNRHKSHIIEKIIEKNMTVSSIKYKENLTEEQALLLETELIKKIGRNDLGLGPLSNLCDGSKGSAGEVPSRYKPVFMYNFNGILIKEYKSIKDASIDNNLSQSSISYVCKKKRDTAGGFIWRFTKDLSNDEIIKIKNRTQVGNFPRKILQYDLMDNFINSYNSIKEAEKMTGCNSSKIVLVCQNKRKQTGGFIFRYD